MQKGNLEGLRHTHGLFYHCQSHPELRECHCFEAQPKFPRDLLHKQ